MGLNFIAAGRQAVTLADEKVVLGPGDAMIWDGAGPSDQVLGLLLFPTRKRKLLASSVLDGRPRTSIMIPFTPLV